MKLSDKIKDIIKKLSKDKYDLGYFKKIDITKINDDELNAILNYYKDQPQEFYTTPEYKKIYIYLRKIYDETRKRLREKGEKAMKEVGIEYGDKVYYDYIDPYMGVHKYEGVIIKGKDRPKVKLTKGTSISGKKLVNWHKGWRKK